LKTNKYPLIARNVEVEMLKYREIGFFQRFLHIFLLLTATFSQPLFDVLSSSPEFFVAHRFGVVEIILLTSLLSLGFPLAVCLAEMPFYLINRNVGYFVHILVVFVLASVFVSFLSNKFFDLFDTIGLPAIALSVIAGAICTMAYVRFSGLRGFLSLYSVLSLYVPVGFLLSGNIYDAVIKSVDVQTLKIASKNNDTPVILIVFDEFNLSGLVDENMAVDKDKFPNFHALSQTSTWYRNAVSPDISTFRTLPVIVTGKTLGEKSSPPNYRNFGFNLLSYFAATGAYNYSEAATDFCPPYLCRGESKRQFGARIQELYADLKVIVLHIQMPRSYSRKYLPRLDTGWKNFGDVKTVSQNNNFGKLNAKLRASVQIKQRIRQSEGFIGKIRRIHSGFDFFHILLPHQNFQFLPDGRNYGEVPTGIVEKVWPSELAAAAGYHRYLWQLGFTDSLLGDLIEKLKHVDKFDRSLVIVTADHGIAFQAGLPSRLLRAENAAEILHIPLFIKYPNQKIGQIDKRTASLEDIAPTIFDVLGTSPPWQMDGTSLLSKNFPVRTSVEIFRKRKGWTVFERSHLVGLPTIGRKRRLFGDKIGLNDLSLATATPELIGREIATLRTESAKARFQFSYSETDFENVDLTSDFIPLVVRGRISGATLPMNTPIALALNGEIVAAFRPSLPRKGPVLFDIPLPPAKIVTGRNEVIAYLISEDSPTTLMAIENAQPLDAKLLTLNGRESIITEKQNHPVAPLQMEGFIDSVVPVVGRENWYLISGWSVDPNNKEPAAFVVLSAGETQMKVEYVDRLRPDVAKHFASPEVELSGFSFTIQLKEKNLPRIFALSRRGFASEIKYSEKAIQKFLAVQR